MNLQWANIWPKFKSTTGKDFSSMASLQMHGNLLSTACPVALSLNQAVVILSALRATMEENSEPCGGRSVSDSTRDGEKVWMKLMLLPLNNSAASQQLYPTTTCSLNDWVGRFTMTPEWRTSDRRTGPVSYCMATDWLGSCNKATSNKAD